MFMTLREEKEKEKRPDKICFWYSVTGRQRLFHVFDVSKIELVFSLQFPENSHFISFSFREISFVPGRFREFNWAIANVFAVHVLHSFDHFCCTGERHKAKSTIAFV